MHTQARLGLGEACPGSARAPAGKVLRNGGGSLPMKVAGTRMDQGAPSHLIGSEGKVVVVAKPILRWFRVRSGRGGVRYRHGAPD
jgi:hypothetical protein